MLVGGNREDFLEELAFALGREAWGEHPLEKAGKGVAWWSWGNGMIRATGAGSMSDPRKATNPEKLACNVPGSWRQVWQEWGKGQLEQISLEQEGVESLVISPCVPGSALSSFSYIISFDWHNSFWATILRWYFEYHHSKMEIKAQEA